MTLKELRELLYWTCYDGANAPELEFLTSGHDIRLINQAVWDLADCLKIIKSDSTLLPDSSGVVTLPSDFLESLRVRWGTYTDLNPINNILNAVDTGAGTSQYMFTGRRTVQLYDVPTPTPSGLAIAPQGTTGAATWGYRVSAVKGYESIVCAEVKITNGNAVLDETNFNRLAWNAVSGATEYLVYRTTSGGTPSTTGYITKVTAATYDDQGAVGDNATIDNKLLYVWYRAYPAALALDADEPSEVPVDYHDSLASVYAAAQFFKRNDPNKAQYLMGQWAFIRKTIHGLVEYRTAPVVHKGDWEW